MKHILTLLLLSLATLTATATGKSFKVTQAMTTYDVKGQLPRENQTVVVTQDDDDTWSLTMKGLALPSGIIGDITFKGVDVACEGDEVYNLSSTSAKGKVNKKSSPYNGKELTLHIGYGQLSPSGAGAQRLEFELRCEADESFYGRGVFAAQTVEDVVPIATYYLGKSATATYADSLTIGIVVSDKDGSVKLRWNGLRNVDTHTPYAPFSLEGLEMSVNAQRGYYTLGAEDAQATFDGQSGATITIQKLSLTLTPNYGTSTEAREASTGQAGDDNEFNLDGTLVLTDPGTGASFTYTLSTDASLVSSIKRVEASATAPTTEIYSLSGTRLSQMQRGVNVVRRQGKTLKVMMR